MPVSVASRYNNVETLTDEEAQACLAQRPVPTLEVPPGSFIHVIIGGETLDQIALRYYAREDQWWRIADANPIRHPSDWRAGDAVVIPPFTRAR